MEISGSRLIYGINKETWKVICKTKDGSRTIYEIKEYPDHEYVAARSAWEGRVLKLSD